MRLLIPLILAAFLVVPTAANATYPGTNGRVVYSASPGPGQAPAVFTANPDGSEVDIANADGTKQRTLAPTDQWLGNQYAEFSPDARTVTYLRSKRPSSGCDALLSIPVTGGRSKVLFAGKGRHCLGSPTSQFDRSPNGKSIAFYASVSARPDERRPRPRWQSDAARALLDQRLGPPVDGLTPD